MPVSLLENAPLAGLNSFRVDACARCLVRIETPTDIPAALALQPHCGADRLVLGGGSNVLFTADFPGLVMQVAIPGIQWLGEDEHYRYLSVGAGVNWHALVRWSVERDYAGLENLALIPGTVGAAPVQNIGAYGVELADVCRAVEAYDLEQGRMHRFAAADCRFGYRDSRFKQEASRWLITAVEFALPKVFEPKTDYPGVEAALAAQGAAGPLTPRRLADAIEAVRRSKLPSLEADQPGSAGSFFKNPLVCTELAEALAKRYPALPRYPAGEGRVKLSAAWLIEQAGWKGVRRGDAGVYDRHALVLVNYGRASGADIWALAKEIIASVQERFGITLEPEPLILPRDADSGV